MRIEQIKCDQCGKFKGEANHWHRIVTIPGPAQRVLTVILGEYSGIALPISNGRTTAEYRDLCGQECLHKHIDQLLFPAAKPLEPEL